MWWTWENLLSHHDGSQLGPAQHYCSNLVRILHTLSRKVEKKLQNTGTMATTQIAADVYRNAANSHQPCSGILPTLDIYLFSFITCYIYILPFTLNSGNAMASPYPITDTVPSGSKSTAVSFSGISAFRGWNLLIPLQHTDPQMASSMGSSFLPWFRNFRYEQLFITWCTVYSVALLDIFILYY